MANCEQQALVEKWTLDMKNACHIAVQNDEMGEMRNTMNEIGWKVDAMMWATAPIYLAIVALAIKKMWGKK